MCFPLPFKMNSPRSAKAAISTFPVDPDGNMLSNGRYDFTWNAENRLISITTKTTEDTKKKKLEFAYDHMGRRTIKKVHSWVNDAWQLDKTIVSVFDNYNEIARFEDGTLAKTFIWGEDLSGSLQGAGGVGGLLLVADTTNTYAPVYDANGNITAYVDANTGNQVAEFSYSPFGRTITKSGSKADEFDYKFSTKPEDEETGFYYYIFRYCDPEVGRWLNRDPIQGNGGENVYEFASNEPISLWDYVGYRVKKLKASWVRDGYLHICGLKTPAGQTDAFFIPKPVTFKKIADLVGMTESRLKALNSRLMGKTSFGVGDTIWIIDSPSMKRTTLYRDLARLAYAEGTPLNKEDKYAIILSVKNRALHKEDYPRRSTWSTSLWDNLYQKKKNGSYEYLAVGQSRFKSALSPEKIVRLKDVKDWNYSVWAVNQFMLGGKTSAIGKATTFHSSASYGNQKKPEPDQIGSAWKATYVAKVGRHYYFTVTPK